MRIGVDIDGVISDMSRFMLDYGSKFFSKQNVNLVNQDAYEISDMFNVSLDLDREFWNKNTLIYVKKKPREFANTIINKLKNEGNKIYLITSRGTGKDGISKEKMKEETIKWLKENNINYDDIFFVPDNEKLEICTTQHIDLMIEDKVENIKNISKVLPVIVFVSNYNKDLSGKNIYKAYSWYDVYYQINNNIF